jgi:hypothetical protein
MARVKYGAIVTEIKGKVGGQVFQRSGQVFSLRNNPSHKIPQSISAQRWRHKIALLASNWRTMSDTNKATWTTYANTFPTVDNFGNPIVLTGYQLYIYVNSVRYVGDTTIIQSTGAYAPPVLSDIDFDPYSISGASFNLLWNNAIAGGTAVRIYVSKRYALNSVNLNPEFSYAFNIASGTAVGTNFYSQLNANLAQPIVAGDYYFWKAVKYILSSGHWIVDNSSSLTIHA